MRRGKIRRCVSLMIFVLFYLLILCQHIYSESRRIRFTEETGNYRDEVITVTTEGIYTVETRVSEEVIKKSRYNDKDLLVEVYVERNGNTFKAVRAGTRIEYTSQSGGRLLKGSYLIGTDQWIDNWEWAAKLMGNEGTSSMKAVIIHDKKPDKPLEIIITREDITTRKGKSVTPFKISPKGLLGGFIPGFYFWVDTSGHLVAQQTLVIPGDSESETKPPQGLNKSDMIKTEDVLILR